ncbi:transcriptional repressor SdpR [Arthrobacter sp. Hiyo8]|nr:transcriptional repressor SdpR [Arthrobacter sp. Hiyo8]
MTDDVFAVIAEATRRDILVSLRSGDKAVGELVEELAASQPTISKHLKVLREADLVSMRAQGQKRYYALNPKPLAGVASWLETFDVGPAKPADEAATPARSPGHVRQAKAPRASRVPRGTRPTASRSSLLRRAPTSSARLKPLPPPELLPPPPESTTPGRSRSAARLAVPQPRLRTSWRTCRTCPTCRSSGERSSGKLA